MVGSSNLPPRSFCSQLRLVSDSCFVVPQSRSATVDVVGWLSGLRRHKALVFSEAWVRIPLQSDFSIVWCVCVCSAFLLVCFWTDASSRIAFIAQLGERQTGDQKVPGSILGEGTQCCVRSLFLEFLGAPFHWRGQPPSDTPTIPLQSSWSGYVIFTHVTRVRFPVGEVHIGPRSAAIPHFAWFNPSPRRRKMYVTRQHGLVAKAID